jgi:hypothetical protein
MSRALLIAACAALSGCVGTTGGDLFEFAADAQGPVSADGESYAFVSGRGYEVRLSRARVHVGAVYLNRAVATSVSQDTSCTLAGIYVAEVTSGVVVDALSAEPQPFPALGYATSDRAVTGEVWLTGGDVNAESDPTVILDVAGVAAKDGTEYPFEGALTIGNNRIVPPSNPALPGAKPICKQRVVSPITVDITPHAGGRLRLRVDPAGMFANVEFSTLKARDDGSFRFEDSSENQASDNLYNGLRASAGVYSFNWQ